MKKLILASNSPRRKQLLSLCGWEFVTSPAEVDERPLPGEEPTAYVLRLAETKARAAVPDMQPQVLVIAADTTVADTALGEGTSILGKPLNEADARQMLQRLRGRVHQVYTAIAVMHPAEERLLTDLCVTDVLMRRYSDEEIEAYIASGDPMDKAGAYAIQNSGFHPVEHPQGCFANVMGLPLCHLVRVLHEAGVSPQADVPKACQAALAYDCPVFDRILRGEV
jgi:septum formation protein